MEAGKPIWVESLMSLSEYSEQARKYPNVYGNGNKPRLEFECEFKWRKGMGAKLPNTEIESINSNLDYIKKHAGLETPVVLD